MADTLKVLAQSNPAAITLTDVYTVPTSTGTTISSFCVCNEGLEDALFRISIAVAGAADNAKQYIYYNTFLPSGGTFIATVGVTLAATDIVRVYADKSTVAFNFFGIEVT
jgi:hypothetical protein